LINRSSKKKTSSRKAEKLHR